MPVRTNRLNRLGVVPTAKSGSTTRAVWGSGHDWIVPAGSLSDPVTLHLVTVGDMALVIIAAT